jgi:hypothetical protein
MPISRKREIGGVPECLRRVFNHGRRKSFLARLAQLAPDFGETA